MSYTPNFRQPRLPYGNLTPGWTHSDSVRPHADSYPAAWLPINSEDVSVANGFFSYDDGTANGDVMVLMAGKAVAYTRENLSVTNVGSDVETGPSGRIVPAGVRVAWAAATGSTKVLEYTAADVAARIEDLATGAPVSAPVDYTKTQLTVALRKRGLLLAAEALESFISPVVGVVATNVYAWAGGDGLQPRGYRFTNYKRQHKVALLCDWVLRLAHVPIADGSVTVPAFTFLANTTDATFRTELELGSPLWLQGDLSTNTALLSPRYGTITNQDWVGLLLGTRRIESSLQCPITIVDGSAVDVTSNFLSRRQSSLENLTRNGDYFIDGELGIIFWYKSGADALPAGVDATLITSSHVITFSYHSAHTENYSPYPAIVGDVRPGQFLVVDKLSNFRPYVARAAESEVIATDGADTTDANDAATVSAAAYVDPTTYDRPEDIVAQVLTMQRFPKEDMKMVKTFWENLGTGLRDRTPGSATGGYSDTLTLGRGGSFEVIINLLK